LLFIFSSDWGDGGAIRHGDRVLKLKE